MQNSKSEIAKAILEIFYAVGLVSLSLVSPNLGGYLASRIKKKSYSIRQLNRSLNSLERKNLISFYKTRKNVKWKLTNDGKRKYEEWELTKNKIKTISDGYCRFVIFDIPMTRNRSRIFFTNFLRQSGFRMFQRSVWVCPYPCESEVRTAIVFYRIQSYTCMVSIKINKNIISILKRVNFKVT